MRLCPQCFEAELHGAEDYCSDLCATRAASAHARAEMLRKVRQPVHDIYLGELEWDGRALPPEGT